MIDLVVFYEFFFQLHYNLMEHFLSFLLMEFIIAFFFYPVKRTDM